MFDVSSEYVIDPYAGADCALVISEVVKMAKVTEESYQIKSLNRVDVFINKDSVGVDAIRDWKDALSLEIPSVGPVFSTGRSSERIKALEEQRRKGLFFLDNYKLASKKESEAKDKLNISEVVSENYLVKKGEEDSFNSLRANVKSGPAALEIMKYVEMTARLSQARGIRNYFSVNSDQIINEASRDASINGISGEMKKMGQVILSETWEYGFLIDNEKLLGTKAMSYVINVKRAVQKGTTKDGMDLYGGCKEVITSDGSNMSCTKWYSSYIVFMLENPKYKDAKFEDLGTLRF